ncbi:YggN family protein [Lysobacter enzymogenes]|uniref:YggN family protein n=1 Tax=Lysobacter enzymogenes TaxID=69 RepID=UPI001AF8AF4A|nr:YggN family protein [Lysobacter enzymogenes]QQQ03577.1 hypothetical protein JHW41_11855 [Lysobacter enzymogenes]
MTARTVPVAALLAAALAAAFAGACSRQPDGGVQVSVIDHISMDGDKVLLRAAGRSAQIGPDGAIAIDGGALALTPAQQALGREFYQQATGMRRDGAAMGKAGAAMAGQALSTVARDLRDGNTDQTEAKIQAEAAKLEAQALQLCQRAQALRDAQQRLSAALPQFEPFARLAAGVGDDCRQR